MKTSKILAITAITFALSMNNFAFSQETTKDSANFSVAVVDIAKIVESSPEINALKVDRKNKIDDLQKFIENARADVTKETNATKKAALEDSYNKELNVRKDAIDKDFSKKMVDIDKNITALIKSKAQKAGYDLTLTKSSVLDGGTDITAEIIKGLK
jgi:outer membrane protein